MPLLQFAAGCPVYFDRHTLSVKRGELSLFTLDGRMRFQLALADEAEAQFRDQKLREIVLSRRLDGVFELSFTFLDEAQDAASEPADPGRGEVPEYVMVEESV